MAADRPGIYARRFAERDSPPTRVSPLLQALVGVLALHRPAMVATVERALEAWRHPRGASVALGEPGGDHVSLGAEVEAGMNPVELETLELAAGALRLQVATASGYCVGDCQLRLSCAEPALFDAAREAVRACLRQAGVDEDRL